MRNLYEGGFDRRVILIFRVLLRTIDQAFRNFERRSGHVEKLIFLS